MTNRRAVTLTLRQAQYIFSVLCGGLDQYQKHLMHDDWDAGMSKAQIRYVKWAEQWFLRAIDLLAKKSKSPIEIPPKQKPILTPKEIDLLQYALDVLSSDYAVDNADGSPAPYRVKMQRQINLVADKLAKLRNK